MALRLAYVHAEEWMGDGTRWEECCEEAANTLAYAVSIDVSSYSIQKWNRQYRSIEAFPHSNKFVATGIKPEPKVFSLFPEAKGRLLTFAANNLDSFSIEKVCNYFNETLFPDLYGEYSDMAVELGETEDELLLYEEFLQYELGFSGNGVSDSTVCRYLSFLDYKYDVRKKTYYVDGHERDDVLEEDRISHVIQFVKSTIRCYEWVQVSKEQLQPLLHNKDFDIDIGCAYQYTRGEVKMLVLSLNFPNGVSPPKSFAHSGSNMALQRCT
jgi:hypothetical protein